MEALTNQLAFNCDLYNAALEQRRDWWRRGQPWWVHEKDPSEEVRNWLAQKPSLYGQMQDLTELRAAGNYPASMNVKAQRDPLRRLDRAFDAFFRRCKAGEKPGHPRFRSKLRYDSLTWPMDDGATITNDGRLRLRGIGLLKVKWHRSLPEGADLRTVTVRRSCGRWYGCLNLLMAPTTIEPHDGPDVGLDLGVTSFARLSTGEALVGPRAGARATRKVKRLQRRVARCQRRSNRRRKAVAILARAKEREANVRRDHRHKLAFELVRRFKALYVEDLRVVNMTRSAKGTIEEPGRNVSQKAGLNRSILDQAWGEFLTVLESEAEEAGSRVVRVPAAHTSQTCARCGVVDARSRVSQAVFACVACGHTEHADTNAAQIIQGVGRTLQASTWPSGACVA